MRTKAFLVLLFTVVSCLALQAQQVIKLTNKQEGTSGYSQAYIYCSQPVTLKVALLTGGTEAVKYRMGSQIFEHRSHNSQIVTVELSAGYNQVSITIDHSDLMQSSQAEIQLWSIESGNAVLSTDFLDKSLTARTIRYQK